MPSKNIFFQYCLKSNLQGSHEWQRFVVFFHLKIPYQLLYSCNNNIPKSASGHYKFSSFFYQVQCYKIGAKEIEGWGWENSLDMIIVYFLF